MRIREIAGEGVRYGYRRIHVLLRREGWEVNHKRFTVVPRRRPESPFKEAEKKIKRSIPCGKSYSLGVNESW